MGVLACAGIMTFGTACKYGRDAPKHSSTHTQKQNLLQPVDFDVLDQYGRIYAKYRDVTYAQSKNLTVYVPVDAKIVLRNIQSIDGFVEDIMVYYNGLVVGGHAFKEGFNFKGRSFKVGDEPETSIQLEDRTEFAGAIRFGIRMVPSPEPEPQSEPKPRRERTVRIYEPVEERLEPSPVQVIYIQKEYVNARPAGGFGFFFGFSSVRRVSYPVGGYAPYPIMAPGPMMGAGCVPYRPPMNYCPPQRQGIQRNYPIHRSSLAPNARRTGPVTRSNLSRNVHPAPVRRR